jgi:hypothetical protein
MPRLSLTTFAIAIAALVLLVPPAAGAGSRRDDQQIADDSAVTSEDVPAGFVQRPAGADESPTRSPECSSLTKAAKALNRAPNTEVSFRQGESSLINNQVSVFDSPGAAKAAFGAYAGKKASACFEQGFEDSYVEQLDDPDAEVEVTIDRYQPDLGDASAGYELEIGIAAKGETQVLYVNLEIARVGRAVDAFGFVKASELFASDDIVSVTDAGMERLDQAL